MIYGERTHRSAFCIGTNGSVAPLTRTPFMSGNFNEAWLQELLEDNPAMIRRLAGIPRPRLHWP